LLAILFEIATPLVVLVSAAITIQFNPFNANIVVPKSVGG